MNQLTPVPFESPRLEVWIQRLAAGAMLALALSLVGVGLAYYLPRPAPPSLSTLSQKDTP